MTEIRHYKEETADGWALIKNVRDGAAEADDETLFTLANGYMGIRGSLGLACSNGCPATFIAGLYDKKETEEILSDRGKVKNKAVTPAYAIVPDCSRFSIEADGIGFDFINGRTVSFERKLDMRRGILFGKYVLRNPDGKTLMLETMAIASVADRHLALFKTEITPLDFDGDVTVRLENGLCRFPQTIRRLKDYISPTKKESAAEENGACVLRARISETGETVTLVSRTHGDGKRTVFATEDGIDEIFRMRLERGKTCVLSKRAVYFTSRDKEASLPQEDEASLLDAHIARWKELWAGADVEISGDDETLTGVRWNIFSLLQVALPGNSDVSVSATGLHGQGYFGHIFWDTEIFLVPFYLAALPQEAESLLKYRCKRLDAAREVAKKEGCSGAKFPWTSAYTGNDVTPPDWAASSSREIHINGAVAYALYNYYEATGDEEFYKNYAIETIVETAKYYASRASLGEDGKFHLNDVTGPDEYNIHVNDNYYTNYLAQWNILRALSDMERLKSDNDPAFARISESAGFDSRLEKRLKQIAENMAFPRDFRGVRQQFDGFFKLKDTGGFKRDEYGMPEDRTRVFDSGIQELKQADIVMMHYLFPEAFSQADQTADFEYYEKRCKHGSSLSPSVHCIVGLRNGITERAYSYFYLTAMLDVKNMHFDKNLYEGAHIACAGGTWAALVYGFGGLKFLNGQIHINPKLPDKWSELSYSFIRRNAVFRVSVAKDGFTVTSDRAAEIFNKGERSTLKPGVPRQFAL